MSEEVSKIIKNYNLQIDQLNCIVKILGTDSEVRRNVLAELESVKGKIQEIMKQQKALGNYTKG